MAQFVFPPVSVTIDYQAADAAAALPSQLAIVGGWSGTAIKAVKVDSTGSLVIGSSGLPTGAATEAKQDDIEATLNSIEGDTSGLFNCVDAGGSQMQVDVVASLPTGSNQIGKLAANDGVDIGNVDVTSIIPGVGATNLGKAIQSPQGTTDTGVPALVVRNDTLADLSGADGDYAPLQVNALGALYVEVKTSALPSGAATSTLQTSSEAILTTINTSLDNIEADADTSAGAVKNIQSVQGTTDAGIPALVVRNDTLADLSGADGDYSPLQVNATGALYTSLATAIPAGTATIGKVDINSYVWKEGLDSTKGYITNDIWDTSGTQALSSTAIIAVKTLTNDIKEIQTVEDIGEFVGLYSGTNLQAILPLGGGTVKINLPSTTVVGLKSLTGTDITSGKIAINFLG
jgi:hypothetical protein